jgi:hypothetical protein
VGTVLFNAIHLVMEETALIVKKAEVCASEQHVRVDRPGYVPGKPRSRVFIPSSLSIEFAMRCREMSTKSSLVQTDFC